MANAQLPGTIQQAPAGLSGFEVDSVLSFNDAQNLKNAGYDFCIRYVPRTTALIGGSLTNEEALNILNAGLALMPMQQAPNDGWAPTAALGTAYGSYAATYATETVALPQGMNLWLELEGVADGTAAADVIAYCQAWYAAVADAGYVPGIYIGYRAILTPGQLYNDLSFQHYWQGYNGPEIATKGYQLIQSTQLTVNGVQIDPATTQNDNLGGSALWLAVSRPQPYPAQPLVAESVPKSPRPDDQMGYFPIREDNSQRPMKYPKSVKDLQVGYINYKANEVMRIGIPESVIAEVFINEVLLKNIENKKNVEQIRLTKRMKAKLFCNNSNFEITPRSSETQPILDDDKTIWSWDVTPLKCGVGILELTLSVAIAVENYGFEMKDLETYNKKIVVKVNPIYSTKKFLHDNWQWAVGLIVGSGVLFEILKDFVLKKP